MKARRILVCVLLLAMLLLSGCGKAVNDWDTMWKQAQRIEKLTDDAEVRQLTEAMLDAILSDQPEVVYELIYPEVDKATFDEVYGQFRAILKDVQMYSLAAAQKNTNLTGSETVKTIRYMFSGGGNTLGEVKLFVDVVHSTVAPQKLVGFHLNSYEEVTQTGTFTTMKGASAGQWMMLVIALLETGFIIWMFVDCCTHKMKRKWLWLILIAVGVFVINLQMGNGFHVNFRMGLYTNIYTAAIAYSNGTYLIRIMVPAGAIVYAILRKNLHKKATLPTEDLQQLAEEPEQQAVIPQIPAEEAEKENE